MILGLALYLIACAGWAKRLQNKDASLRRRQTHGLLAAVIVMAMTVLLEAGDHGIGQMLAYVWSAIVACLGYLTIVYRPKWIVGNR